MSHNRRDQACPQSLANPILKHCVLRWFTVIVFGWIVPLPSLHAQTAPVLLGFTGTLTGVNADYGQGLLHGARLALEKAKAQERVAIELLVLDDEGDPVRAASNANQLLQRGALALTGVHGAERTLAVAKSLLLQGEQTAQAALVAPATSADTMRDPPLPGVFHLRAGALEEASAAVLHLDTIGISRYALVAQDDAFGDSAHDRIASELIRITMRPVAIERVAAAATSADVSHTMSKLCAARPEAVILALDPARAMAAIASGRERRCAGHYLVFSETGAAIAARKIHGVSGHVLVTQVVPHPAARMHPLAADYQQALLKFDKPEASSYPSLEGYFAMSVILKALQSCRGDNHRGCVLQALRTKTFEVSGLRVHFGSAQRQVRPFVEVTLLDAEGRFRR